MNFLNSDLNFSVIRMFFLPKSHRKETKKLIGQLPLHTVKHGEKVIFS